MAEEWVVTRIMSECRMPTLLLERFDLMQPFPKIACDDTAHHSVVITATGEDALTTAASDVGIFTWMKTGTVEAAGFTPLEESVSRNK